MEIKGDFLGFTFAGVRSESLNIVRTSDGDRFEESILPEIRDISVEVPGMDGEYFFGSTYGKRNIEVAFAFDSMTEVQFRRLQKTFGQRRQGELIFDERPYKKYIAKIESPIELSYVCFDEPIKTIEPARDGVRVANRRTEVVEEDGEEVERIVVEREQVTPYSIDYTHMQRIYKGEGKISFVCYFPFAKSVFKILNTTALKNSDWAVSSGLMTDTEYANYKIDTYDEGVFNVYNAGDVPTGFRLYGTSAANQIRLDYEAGAVNGWETASLIINPFTLKNGDVGFIIDTNSGLVVGVSEFSYTQDGNVTYTTSGNLYNEYVDSGYFFKLLPNMKGDGAKITVTGGDDTMQIFYDYLYF